VRKQDLKLVFEYYEKGHKKKNLLTKMPTPMLLLAYISGLNQNYMIDK